MYSELTMDQFIQNLMEKRRMGLIICQLAVSTLEVGKLVTEISQFVIIFIKALVGKILNCLFS